MPLFKNLAGALNKPLALSPQMRSALVQHLLQQSAQAPQGTESGYGTANKVLQGLLMRRANIADRQENELDQVRQQALAGQLSRAGQGGPQGEAARRAALITSGGMPNNPLAQHLLAAQAQNIMSPGGSEPYTLSPGQVRYGTNNQPVASVPEAIDSEKGLPKLVNDISDDLYKESTDFTTQFGSIGRIRQSATEPSAAGDMAMIYNYMKLLDPNSVVREAEYATAENARGVPSTIRNLWNKILNGERLADDQRADFLNRAERLFAQARADQSRRNDRFLTRATSLGVPEDMFRPLLIPVDPAQINREATPTPTPAPKPVVVPPGPASRVIP